MTNPKSHVILMAFVLTIALALMNSIVSTICIIESAPVVRQTISRLSATSPSESFAPASSESVTPPKKKEMFQIDMSNYTGPARAFPIYPHPFPCYPESGRSALMSLKPTDSGLLFHRPHKTGSTSMSSIVMRLANRRAKKLLSNQPLLASTNSKTNKTMLFCRHRAMHGSGLDFQYANRDRSKSFLFTMVRNPTKRIISHFFHFVVSAYHYEPTDATFQRHLALDIKSQPLLRDAILTPVFGNSSMVPEDFDFNDAVQQVLDDYDFIMVTERYDESLVALKMLLNLDFEDIIYTRERSEGSFTNGFSDRPCIYLVPSFVTPGMKKYFLSDHWNEFIKGDKLLYQAAYKSLDLTIDRLGRDEFNKQLAYFQRVNKEAQAICGPREIGICTEAGEVVPIEKRTCIIWSEGCSHECLDEIKLSEDVSEITKIS